MLEPYRYYEFIGRCSTLDERSSEKSCPFGRRGMSFFFFEQILFLSYESNCFCELCQRLEVSSVTLSPQESSHP